MCVVLTQITRFLLGDLLTFFTLQACIFYYFYLFVIGVILSENLGGCFFGTIHLFSLG